MTTPREEAVVRIARGRCICQEEAGASPCECAPPVTRGQIGRLRAFLSEHPDRAVIYCGPAGEWLAALHAFLPAAEEPLEAWLRAPFDLPVAADLRHAANLGLLLDMLYGPAAGTLS